MSNLSDKYIIRHLKDDIYQLIEKHGRDYEDDVVEQGTYSELLAYIKLNQMGLL